MNAQKWAWYLRKNRYVLAKSSRLEVFCKKGLLRNFEKFTGKHLYQSLFFNKAAGLRPLSQLSVTSVTGAFQWILHNFLEHLFCRTPPYHCFRFSAYRLLNPNNFNSFFEEMTASINSMLLLKVIIRYESVITLEDFNIHRKTRLG